MIGSVEEFQRKYRAMKQLGDGGYGTVYLCEHLDSGEQRAVKIMDDRRCTNRTFVPSLDRTLPNEIVLWQKVSHPNIVPLLEVYYDTDTKQWCLVMEYDPDFVDLFEYASQKGVLSDQESTNIVKQLVQVVNYLTLQEIDHRDLKDENMLYNPTTQQMKLIDFGAAAHLPSEPYTRYHGTDLYIPPEFYTTGQYFSSHGTVWSIGCLAFILLTGNSPFESREAITGFNTLEELKPDLSATTPRLNFIRSCLKLSTTDRISLSDLSSHPWLNDSPLEIEIFGFRISI